MSQLICNNSQLIFFLQHPIIEPASQPPTQHLVHACSSAQNQYNIYPARNVSDL